MNIFEGHLLAENLNVAVVVSRFNELITSKLLGGAKDCFIRHGGLESKFYTAWTPGAFELPLVCQKLARSKQFDSIVALGAVIRGSTSHFDYVCKEVSKGIAQISLQEDCPVIFGVLTTDTIDQALERAGTKHGNKGYESMAAGIEMAQLSRVLPSSESSPLL